MSERLEEFYGLNGRCYWCYRQRETRRHLHHTTYGDSCYVHLCEECIRKAESRNVKIEGKTVCEILDNHHRTLHDDPERLSTDFLKKMIGSSARNCMDEQTQSKGVKTNG